MIKFIFIELFIYLLEMVVSIYVTPVLLPLFGLFYVLITSRYIPQTRTRFLFCIFSGLFYDLLVTSTPFMNTLLFPLLSLLIHQFDTYFLKNKFTFLFLFFLEIFLYRTLTYLILILIQYQPFTLIKYINSMLYSIILNLAFVIICNFVFLRRKNTM